MLSLITPENLPATLTAIGGLIGGGGIITVARIWRNPTPKPGTPDATSVALVENTKAALKMEATMAAMVDAMKGQNNHFGDNNAMFRAMGPLVATLVHDMAECKAHLSSIRDRLNQGPR